MIKFTHKTLSRSRVLSDGYPIYNITFACSLPSSPLRYSQTNASTKQKLIAKINQHSTDKSIKNETSQFAVYYYRNRVCYLYSFQRTKAQYLQKKPLR